MITGITLALKENSRSAETNTTNVTISATITWNSGSWDSIGKTVELKIDGTTVQKKENVCFNINNKGSGSEEFYSYTTDIEHNINGDKTLACELIYYTNLLGGTRTASANWPLTQIPRASTIAATAADIGAVSMISVNRKNSAYTHTIAYKFGALSGYIRDADGNAGDSAVKLAAANIAFTIPESFYGQIPNATSGECTLTCRTYSGTTQIGEDKTCKFRVTANADDCRPVVTGTVVDVNEVTAGLTGYDDVIILNASTALCTMNVQVKHGATVQTRMIAGRSVTENSLRIERIEQREVVFSVTDSRGYTGTYTAKPRVVGYVPLTCNPVAKRVDPTSGKVLLTVSGKYYKGLLGDSSNPSATENRLTIRYTAAPDDRIYDDVIPEDAFSFDGDNYSAQIELEGFDYRYSYTMNITANDALYELERTATVGKGLPVFDWGEHDFNFNVPVSFQGATMTDFVVEQGTNDSGWHYRKWLSRKIELWKRVQLETAIDQLIELGTGDPILYYSADILEHQPHGFNLNNPIEIATVIGDKGCWLAAVGTGIGDCTNEYRLYSYEYSAKSTHYINFYIFANDYD